MGFFKRYFKNYKGQGGVKEVMFLALPMVASTACDAVMTFTDRLFLSKLGYEQMNAAMGGGISYQMLIFFFIGLIGYSTALVGQYFGAKEHKKTIKTLFQSLIIVAISYPAILILKPFVIQIFSLIGTPKSQLPYQIEYLNILALGSLISLFRHVISCYFTGIGKTRIVMYSALTAMLVNIFFDYIFIFGKLGLPAMGIAGAAYASIAGQIISSLLLLIFLVKNMRENRVVFSQFARFNKEILFKLVRYGTPAGLEMFLNFISFAAIIAVFHSQGDVVATAATVMFNWDLISFVPLIGLEIAITSLAGRYMGAQKPELAHRATISAIRIGTIYSVIILVIFIFIPEALARLFSPFEYDEVFETAVPISASMIRIAALYVMSESVMVSVVGALRGAGDTFYTMLISVTAHWLFVPILIMAFNVFNFTAIQAWFLVVMFFLVFTLILYKRFKRGRWKNIKVIG
ncbi:MAG: MATE family efflux transporter [Bacteroidales bacterium]|jgi:MATE family multidrug resistance protein|nr:MATE family efflux transporter [Bacteroidales bacterium]